MDIQPIDQRRQSEVIAEVERYIGLAESLYDQPFGAITVKFDLRGRAAGMYRVISALAVKASPGREIRFNPWLFAKYFTDNFSNTIPHEVAHYISDCLYGLNTIKPHGCEWQQIMMDFGADPKIYADYDLTGIPVRHTRRYDYSCGCREVALTAYRHKKIQRGLQEYLCRDCLQPLVLKSGVKS